MALTENTNYPTLNLSDLQKQLWIEYLIEGASTSIYTQNKILKDFYGQPGEKIGERQLDYLQALDHAVQDWKIKNGVEYINPGESFEVPQAKK